MLYVLPNTNIHKFRTAASQDLVVGSRCFFGEVEILDPFFGGEDWKFIVIYGDV